ncbi:MAG: CAP domain-containing protein [Microgenomates group bacterium]
MQTVVRTIGKFSFILLSILLITTTNVRAAARDITPESVLVAVNQTRMENRLPALSMNQKLMIAAENKGENMQTYGYWAHTNPKTNETGWMFIQQTGYHYTKAGENLAKDYTSIGGLLNGWMNSTAHKTVMLSDTYTETGIGVLYYMQNGIEKALVVELFANPIVKKQTFTTSLSLAFTSLLQTITL